MDGDVFGPYSAKAMMELDVLPDIMVTEDSIDTWQPAEDFDFAQLAKQEVLERLKSTPTNDTPDASSALVQKREQLKSRLNDNDNFSLHFTDTGVTKNGDGIGSSFATHNSFPDSIKYNANFNEGLNSIGGKIIITPTQLIFHPHKINFGDLSDRVFEISQITGYEKGILSFMYISLLDGSKIKLSVWNKSDIINQLEARRSSLVK